MAPATQPSANPCAFPIPISATPMVAIVVHELPSAPISSNIINAEATLAIFFVIDSSKFRHGTFEYTIPMMQHIADADSKTTWVAPFKELLPNVFIVKISIKTNATSGNNDSHIGISFILFCFVMSCFLS